MKIRAYTPVDLQKIAIQPEQQHEFSKIQNPQFNFTITADEKVLGVFGLLQTGYRRLAVSSFISKDAGNYLLPIVRTLKNILNDGMKKTGNNCIDMSVLANFNNGKKFARLLGFEFNQSLPAYFDGKDYELYTWRLK